MAEFKKFDELVQGVKDAGDMFWQEQAKLEFAKGVGILMADKGISKTDLAKILNVSQARITQCLRGDRNLQIETMVSIARAVGGELHLRVHDRAHTPRFFECIDGNKKPKFDPVRAEHRIYVRDTDEESAVFA